MLLTSHTLPVARSLRISFGGRRLYMELFFKKMNMLERSCAVSQLLVCSSEEEWCCDVNDGVVILSSIHPPSPPTPPPLTCVQLKKKNLKKIQSTSALSPFWRKAVGCNFPPIFGMTLSGPVGIEAPVSHHAAGGMINNKHWWILHCPCGLCHYQAAPKYHLQL